MGSTTEYESCTYLLKWMNSPILSVDTAATAAELVLVLALREIEGIERLVVKHRLRKIMTS